MPRPVVWVSALALVVFLLAAVRLGRLERGGPAHADLVLEGGIPATLYVPWEGSVYTAFRDAPPRDERPPAVVFMHGISADRRGMSSPARRIAAAGYAVLCLDVRGHGENRNPFTSSYATADSFYPDLAAAVDFLRASPFVDGSRLAVMGHSMGAGGALDYATRDSGIDAAVLISGGWKMVGPYRPPNALFLVAERDPPPVRERSGELAARLADSGEVELGRTYGDPAKGTALRAAVVPGTGHATILWSEGAIREIVAWLDLAFGVERSATAETPDDPRLGTALALLLAALLVLPGLGFAVGRLAPPGAALPEAGRGSGLLVLGGALVAGMPLLASGVPGRIVTLEIGDVVVTHFAITGIALLCLLALRSRVALDSLLRRPLAVVLAAAVGAIGVYLLLFPVGVVFHRTTLTPERTVVFAVAALALVPFALAFQLLLRRGPPLGAGLYAAAGRVLVLASLVAGVAFGVLGPVAIVALPPLALIFVPLEVLASSIYATSRNLVVIALVDAASIAWVVASTMPIRA